MKKCLITTGAMICLTLMAFAATLMDITSIWTCELQLSDSHKIALKYAFSQDKNW